MIVEEIKNIKSEKSDLRKFGMIIGVALALFGGLFFWRGRDFYFYFIILSPAFLLIGIIFPILLKPFHKVWMSIAIIMGWFMTKIILGILFFLVITPIGLLSRLFAKDFLKLKFNKQSESYWIPKEHGRFDKSKYEKQF